MDEYYLIRLSDEVRRGMTERATRGLPNVAPPFGYRMVNGRYEIEEAEAVVVRTIFEMFVAGHGHRSIATYLRELGIKNRNGNHLDNRGVEYILNNPCYIGYLRWNPHGRSASERKYKNPEDILTKASHAPIVSEELFQQAQNLLDERKRANQKYAREEFQVSRFMLKGMVKCHTCGSTLVYVKSTDSLQCHRYSKGLCPVSHNINLPILEQMVIDAMKNAVLQLSFSIEQTEERPRTDSPIDFDTLIRAEELKLERARQAYQAGVDSLNEYRASKERLEKQIQTYREQKEKTRTASDTVDLKKFAQTVSGVIELIESPDTSPELKNKALKSVLNKIVFYKPDKHSELFFYI